MDWKRLEEIESRVKVATEGPWENDSDGEFVLSPKGPAARTILSGDYDGDVIASREDKAFILNARSDVPWLIERLREVQRAAAEIVPLMRDQLEDMDTRREVGDDPEVVIRLLSPFLPSEEKPADE